MAVVAETNQRLGELQGGIDADLRIAVDQSKDDYIEFQTKQSEAEASIELLARRNPQWFEKKKTLTTPYGSVKLTESSSIEVKNESATIALIKHLGVAEDFLRTTEELNKEALEALSDEELALYGLARKRGECCTIKPAKVELGKAIAAANKAAAKAKGKGAK